MNFTYITVTENPLWYVNGHLNTNHSHDAEIGIYCSYIVQCDTSDVGSIYNHYISLWTILFQHSVKFSRSSVFVFEFFAQWENMYQLHQHILKIWIFLISTKMIMWKLVYTVADFLYYRLYYYSAQKILQHYTKTKGRNLNDWTIC